MFPAKTTLFPQHQAGVETEAVQQQAGALLRLKRTASRTSVRLFHNATGSWPEWQVAHSAENSLLPLTGWPSTSEGVAPLLLLLPLLLGKEERKTPRQHLTQGHRSFSSEIVRSLIRPEALSLEETFARGSGWFTACKHIPNGETVLEEEEEKEKEEKEEEEKEEEEEEKNQKGLLDLIEGLIPSRPDAREQKPVVGRLEKIRLYLRSEQKKTLAKWFGTARWTYNKAVEFHREHKRMPMKEMKEQVREKFLNNGNFNGEDKSLARLALSTSDGELMGESQAREHRRREAGIIALDPGVRTFMTTYNGCGEVTEWGNADINETGKLCHRLDRMQSKGTKGNHRQRRRLRRAAARLRHRIRHLVDDLHKKLVSWLVRNFSLILLSEFRSQQNDGWMDFFLGPYSLPQTSEKETTTSCSLQVVEWGWDSYAQKVGHTS
ncbi:Transposase, IS605 OrfB family, central region [Balamuthia mandrillaris]